MLFHTASKRKLLHKMEEHHYSYICERNSPTRQKKKSLRRFFCRLLKSRSIQVHILSPFHTHNHHSRDFGLAHRILCSSKKRPDLFPVCKLLVLGWLIKLKQKSDIKVACLNNKGHRFPCYWTWNVSLEFSCFSLEIPESCIALPLSVFTNN